MSAFQQRYTPRAKRAVGLAQLDGGMTARSALDAFHTGALRDSDGPIPPPAGAMPLSTAHDCARKIRQQREGRRGGLERAEAQAIRAELGRRLVVATDRLTKRLERKSRRPEVIPQRLTAEHMQCGCTARTRGRQGWMGAQCRLAMH
jgi:hypothetical protein